VDISVLVVDDDAGFRGLALRILRASGFRVIGEAESCATGMAAALALRPSALLVDVRLPDGDGVTLARALAALPWQPRILLTSSDGDAAAHVAASAGGALAFVPKADLPNAPLPRLLGEEWQGP
jgi:DNA-binding NarL/FixJ family response regulator